MIKINKLKKLSRSYPYLSNLGYNIFKNIWKIEAEYFNYNYPENKKESISIDKVKDYNKNRILGPRKKICYAPSNNMHFQINGDVTSCSFNSKLKIGNVENQSLIEIWRSDAAKQFRNEIADYNLNKCQSCKLSLNFGNYSSFPAIKYDIFSSDNTDYPTQMSFEMSNLCNYECIMCNEDLSSMIRKRKGLSPLKFTYPDNFIQQLIEFIPHLSIATFIGGEPLLIKHYYPIWEEILKHNKNCTIHLQTNGSILPPKFINLLDSGQFEIGVSIDAASEEVFERIRINSNFKEVEKNIDILIYYYKLNKINLNFNFCLMIENWNELPLMLEYSNNKNVPLNIIHVDGPYELDIKNQPSSVIQDIYHKLKSTEFENKHNSIIQKRNVETFNKTLDVINKYIEYALNIEYKSKKYELFSYDDILVEFENSLFSLEIFSHLNIEIKIEIKQHTLAFINSLTNDDRLKREVFIRLLLFFYETEHDMDDNINYKQFYKYINGFYLLSYKYN